MRATSVIIGETSMQLKRRRNRPLAFRHRGKCLKLLAELPIQEEMPADPRRTVQAEPGDADLPLLAERLVAESACDLQTSDGQAIEAWLISSHGTTVVATAPRLSVRQGMELVWRTHLDDGPVAVTLVIADAGYRSERRADVALRVV
jgi:hypothetical protein